MRQLNIGFKFHYVIKPILVLLFFFLMTRPPPIPPLFPYPPLSRSLIALQPAVFRAPAIVRYFRHTYRPNCFCDRPTLRGQHVNLPQLRDDLFSCMSLSCHPSVDRKSTRLNSSHSQISYAVFCLKKK